MEYNPFVPPLAKDYEKMTTRELRSFFRWFLDEIPVRLRELQLEIRRSSKFRTWQGNFSARSIQQLGSWFAENVETREYTRAEVAQLKRDIPFALEDLRGELTGRSLSYCVDVGIYLAEGVRRKYPEIFWAQNVRAKTDADFGQPLLAGFTVPPINPIGCVLSVAYSIARKKSSGRDLLRLLQDWLAEAKLASST